MLYATRVPLMVVALPVIDVKTDRRCLQNDGTRCSVTIANPTVTQRINVSGTSFTAQSRDKPSRRSTCTGLPRLEIQKLSAKATNILGDVSDILCNKMESCKIGHIIA